MPQPLTARIFEARNKEATLAELDATLTHDADRFRREQEAASREVNVYARAAAHLDAKGELLPDHAAVHAEMLASVQAIGKQIEAVKDQRAKVREDLTAVSRWLATVTATDAEIKEALEELEATRSERQSIAAQIAATGAEAAELEGADDSVLAELQVTREDALAAGLLPKAVADIDTRLNAARDAKRKRDLALRDLSDRERGLRRKLVAADTALTTAEGRFRAVERAWTLGQLQGKARSFQAAVEALRAAYGDLARAAREFAAAGGRKDVVADVFGPRGEIYLPAVPGIGSDTGPDRRPIFAPRLATDSGAPAPAIHPAAEAA